MKKTNEELLQFFGLKIGDKIKVDGYYHPFVIGEENGNIFAKRENCLSSWDYYDIGTLTDVLLNCDYKTITPKKKLGEMKCGEIFCSKCPFRTICEDCAPSETLSEIFEAHEKKLKDVKEKLNAIKAELDRNVEECEK